MPSLDARSYKILWPFFQPTEGSNTKPSGTKSEKFPWVLKPGIPKEKRHNSLQQGNITICLVLQRVCFGGMKTHLYGVLMHISPFIWLLLSYSLRDESGFSFCGINCNNDCDSHLRFLAGGPAEGFSVCRKDGPKDS